MGHYMCKLALLQFVDHQLDFPCIFLSVLSVMSAIARTGLPPCPLSRGNTASHLSCRYHATPRQTAPVDRSGCLPKSVAGPCATPKVSPSTFPDGSPRKYLPEVAIGIPAPSNHNFIPPHTAPSLRRLELVHCRQKSTRSQECCMQRRRTTRQLSHTFLRPLRPTRSWTTPKPPSASSTCCYARS